MNRPPISVRASVFLRSLLIQSGWNYRTMIGGGIAFAMIPVLRYLRRLDGDGAEARLDHYGAHFNAHPYLASTAIGSLARMEVDGEGDEKIARFRDAVRGPLGALGDRLVWAGWLPLCALLGLAIVWAGGAWWIGMGVFLLVYNLGHVGMRIWGFRTGWDAGAGLAVRLREAKLPRLAAALDRLVPIALGLVVGLAAAGGAGVTSGRWALGAVVGGTALGLGFGSRAWKPAAATVVATVGIMLLYVWTR